jgi:hypothetical protein
MGVRGLGHAPPGLLSGTKIWRSLFRTLDILRGHSEQVLKISLPPHFKLQTVQPAANRYTYHANQATIKNKTS